MTYITTQMEDAFLEAGISVEEILAEEDYEKDEVYFSMRSPLDVEDVFMMLVWEISIEAGNPSYMADQINKHLKAFVIKDEITALTNTFERAQKEHPELYVQMPTKKAVTSEVRAHKEFMKKIYQILTSEEGE